MPATYMGFPHDRRFMLFNVAQRKNMAVAHFTEMCLFTTAFSPNGEVIVTYTKDHVFDHPDRKVGPELLPVPLSPETAGLAEVEVTMHYSPCIGYDMGEEYNRWFSERFGYEVKLLYIGGNRRKVLGNMPPKAAAQERTGAVASANAGANSWLGSITSTATSLARAITGAGDSDTDKEDQYEGIDEGISFADVAPYLVISTKSWENAQRRLPADEEMDISKFRPNIIVEGADEDFEEDYWAEILIGDAGDGDESRRAKIVLTQNCARCNSLNVDYATGKVGEGESGKILKKLQSDRRVDPGAKWSPVFGRYGFLARVPEGKSAAEIKVGDEVTIVRRNSERTRFVWPNLST
ncbi:MOSC domain-containing protein [Cladophialophora immunda]|nr:MOSC domain-containing protein [Cladophialophora immunda]